MRNVYIPPGDKRAVVLAVTALPPAATGGHVVGDLNIDLAHPRDATELALGSATREAYARWGVVHLRRGGPRAT
eukprot:11027384-Alexandrium_andersonii.AAC.1